MELLILFLLFGFAGAGKLVRDYPQLTHIIIICVGIVFGILSVLSDSGFMIAFFIFIFGIYTSIYALHSKIGPDYFPTGATLLLLLIGMLYIGLITVFHNVGTFFLAIVTMLYWIRELTRLPRTASGK